MFNILATKYKSLTKTSENNGLFVFTTLLQRGTKAHLLKEHCHRLHKHACLAGFPKSQLGNLLETVTHLLQSNPTPDYSKTRIQLLLDPHSEFKVTLKQVPVSFPVHQQNIHVQYVPSKFRPSEDERLKSNNYSPYFELIKDTNRSLFLDDQSNITSGLFENFFAANPKEKILTTPELNSLVLSGITRNWVLKRCEELGWRTQEKKIHMNEIKSYSSAFFTSSIQGIVPIKKISKTTLVECDFIEKLTKDFNYRILQVLDC